MNESRKLVRLHIRGDRIVTSASVELLDEDMDVVTSYVIPVLAESDQDLLDWVGPQALELLGYLGSQQSLPFS